jgi:hypothetical protein
MKNALHLPDDASPTQVAVRALYVARYRRPDPTIVMTDPGSSAVRFLSGLVDGVDTLPSGAGPADRSGVVDRVLDGMNADAQSDALGPLNDYVNPSGAPRGPEVSPAQLLRHLADRVVAAVAGSVGK